MKAREIDLTPYPLVPEQLEENAETGEMEPITFDVQGSLIELLFHPELKLRKTAVLEADEVARTIKDAEGDKVVLSEADHSRLVRAITVHEGWTRNQVELIRRVDEAKSVEMVVDDDAEMAVEDDDE